MQRPNQWKTVKLFHTYHDSKYDITGLAADQNGNLYFTLGEDGLWKWNQKENNGKPIFLHKLNYEIRGLVWDHRHNKLYMGGLYLSVYSLDSATMEYISFPQYDEEPWFDGLMFDDGIIALDKDSYLYCVDKTTVYKIDISQKIVQVIFQMDSNSFNCFESIAIGYDGTIYLSDLENNCIREVKGNSTTSSRWGCPRWLGVDRDGILWNVRDWTIYKCDTEYVNEIVKLDFLNRIAFGKNGVIYASSDSTVHKCFVERWNYERFLWIGKLKEESSCHLTRLPKDVIQEIAQYLPGECLRA